VCQRVLQSSIHISQFLSLQNYHRRELNISCAKVFKLKMKDFALVQATHQSTIVWWVINYRNLLLTVLEDEGPRSGGQHCWVLVKAPFPIADYCLCLYFYMTPL
jgi:hypothetical protein